MLMDLTVMVHTLVTMPLLCWRYVKHSSANFIHVFVYLNAVSMAIISKFCLTVTAF